MYVRVYAPNGEPFDVSRDRADTLILERGWTQSPPVPVEQGADEDKAARRRARRKESFDVSSVVDDASLSD